MHSIKELSPNLVWHYFDEITKIPRPSKHEEKIREYILNFAKEFNLDFLEDETGNIVIKKDTTKGKEKNSTLVLQSHIDMVTEKNSDSNHNFMTDPIKTYIEDGWVKAKGTTLGADNGLGVAAQLAILASSDITHGPIEALFTVDEETGLTGAFGLGEKMISGSTLINLDSEDDGQIFIGCAGGVDTIGKYTPQYEETPKGYFAIEIKISGLKGGHSGDDIEKKLASANKLLVRFLWNAQKEYNLRIASIEGGNLRNAIAREAQTISVIPNKFKEEIRVLLNIYSADIEEEYKNSDSNIKLELSSTELPEKVFTEKFQTNFLNGLYILPHGVVAMSQEIDDLVETSTNFASIKNEDGKIVVSTSQRSSLESKKEDIANQVASIFRMSGAEVIHTDGYPGWAPNKNSNILKLAAETYKELFDIEPEIRAIHAGLECGLFLEKKPGLDMVSIGPTIKGAHSPDERMEIKTVERFWNHLITILDRF